MLYSETTSAVGIAQLTHHEGGGKNPETECRFALIPHFIWVTIFIF